MIEIVYLSLFMTASFSFGRKFLKLLKCEMGLLEEIVFGLVLGFIAISLITFFCGIFGLIYRIIFIIIFLLLLVLSVFDLYYIYNKTRENKFHFDFGFNLDTILILLLAFLIIINFVPSMAPPWGFDETSYHLVPKIYIKNHAITYLPSIFGSNLPFFTEMIYLFALIIKNAIFARVVAYLFAIILVLGMVSFSKRVFNTRVGLVGAIIMLTTPAMMEVMVKAGTDVLVVLFCFFAFYSSLVWYNELKISWLVLSGIMIGAAFSTKYISILMYIPLLLLLLFRLYTLKRRVYVKLYNALIFCIIPLLIFLPWMIKSYVYTGNPVFPFYIIYFGELSECRNSSKFKRDY